MHKVRQHQTEYKRILVEILSMETRAEVDDACLCELQNYCRTGTQAGCTSKPRRGEMFPTAQD